MADSNTAVPPGDPRASWPSAPPPTPPTLFPWFAAIRRRIISGLIFALPIAITFWIVYWLYSTLQGLVIDPIAQLVRRVVGAERWAELPPWWQTFVSPLIAVGLALTFLYFLGLFGRSRVHRVLNWILLRVPIVSVVFKAVSNVFNSLASGPSGAQYKRVVLLPFPSREVRTPALVASSLQDRATGRTILCVYIPYCPVPTTGMLLTVPEEEVIEIDWDVKDVMQAVISFGTSTPDTIDFFRPGTNGPGPAPASPPPRAPGALS